MIYCMSDIHGELDRFKAMLDLINFSSDDTLYIIGDVIDRHPGGVEILKIIKDTPNMFMLLGNHEQMCLDTLGPNSVCEDSIGRPSTGFRENKAGLPQNSITRGYAFLRCFRPGFSVRGSRRGSTGDFRSCSHVTFCVAGINKTFLEKVIAFRQQLWYVLWLQKRRCRNV